MMQLMPVIAKHYGVVDLLDPVQNLHGGAQYLRDMLLLFNNDVSLAVAAFNAGETAVVRYGNRITTLSRDHELRTYGVELLSGMPENSPASIRCPGRSGSICKVDKYCRDRLMLTWINPQRRGQSLVAPVAVISTNQELGLLVSRDNKYAKILRIRSGLQQLWTVPIEFFDANWGASGHPIQIDIQRFLAHGKKFGAARQQWKN